jgi:GTP:adenosylcobinamide-phosphate guanylyltransferase
MTAQQSFFTALVLAGNRSLQDPLAQAWGSPGKVLIPVAGVPMLVRVVRSISAASQVAKIVVSSDDPSSLHALPELAVAVESGVLSFHYSRNSPAESVVDYATRFSMGEPLLVTSADHPLLTAEMVDYFCRAACASGADVVAGVVAASLFSARYPQSRRTFIRLRGESFCGANLFTLHTPRAVAAARFWSHAGQFRKRPWRLVSTFGLSTLALFALRRLDLHAAVTRVSQILGVRVAAVQMPFAECAIDVDNAADLALATHILCTREQRC